MPISVRVVARSGWMTSIVVEQRLTLLPALATCGGCTTVDTTRMQELSAHQVKECIFIGRTLFVLYTIYTRRYVARVDKSHPLIALSSQSL